MDLIAAYDSVGKQKRLVVYTEPHGINHSQ